MNKGIKKSMFEYLDGLQDASIIKMIEVTKDLNNTYKRETYPDTYLRYLREYRKRPDVWILCTSREKSEYQIFRGSLQDMGDKIDEQKISM